jgi:hypothetical protein
VANSGYEAEENHMTDGLVQYVLMIVFFGVIAFVPIGWFLLGLKSYGTGDYHQP